MLDGRTRGAYASESGPPCSWDQRWSGKDGQGNTVGRSTSDAVLAVFLKDRTSSCAGVADACFDRYDAGKVSSHGKSANASSEKQAVAHIFFILVRSRAPKRECRCCRRKMYGHELLSTFVFWLSDGQQYFALLVQGTCSGARGREAGALQRCLRT